MSAPQFIGLCTGRCGSRYLTGQLSAAGVKTLHDKPWQADAIGATGAQFVTQMDAFPSAQVWHFSRHPQPFVTSLVRFGFWHMNDKHIHPYLRHTGDLIADSFLYWVDWNRRILSGATHPRRTSFRIEDINADLVSWLANAVGVDADVSKINPEWNERQEFAAIPDGVKAELIPMMEILGYAQGC